ncbi:MAG: hypothetical protein A2821_00220 [Candidatus Magasanikbacteria bacterium RIFCSPHIGHO2_01_FULL_41_23]|uniref:Glycosyltransferase 2-like domain-containing protein n=1 Tax=Candidatus Magasanikbacteria bacterium RIFCSPLOWO2_01_FULL_40_15 TaxID=1798686 RepID=A0A1F6N4E4_9BACT|nr:MAG: hypothetical protein A2821_00220 [Candidatus Magasanikbacteria bacterium RIFCSPHIGHO2_01_FULL_41_23]OGH76582.1 MAG: hypothetical protein A3F22_04550 [Candidatus Magasanikbacteria bacterium RIFCSPHIGHO2_12_FULL_41_16]OGH78560.1 MAG: hypothetical protein A2983_02750 [Candidatus Magasanikbacteria bacterium RIFCSPLOWO2_01_FULL_40_15]
MKPIIVIPTYNERANIIKLIPTLFALKIPELQVIIVDDNSPDETAHEVEILQDKFPVHLIKRLRKLGLGTAYLTGFKKALALNADIIFEMDADFSHDPADVPRLIDALVKLEGAELAIGSRRVDGGKIIGWNIRRHCTSFIAMTIARIMLGLKTKDVTSGFRAYRRPVLEAILKQSITSNGYAFQEEMLFHAEKMNWKIIEIPVTFIDRKIGQSKLSTADILEFFRVMWRLRKQ